MKDKLYKIVHWIGIAKEGLRMDQSPPDGLVSDAVLTVAIRDDPEAAVNIVTQQLPVTDLFENNLIVNSLDGQTAKPITPMQHFRLWALLTLYIHDVQFKDIPKSSPHKMFLELTLRLLSMFAQLLLRDEMDKATDLFKSLLNLTDMSAPVGEETPDAPHDTEHDERFN